MADLAGLYPFTGWRSPASSRNVSAGALAGLGVLGLSVLALFALGIVIWSSQSHLRARFGLIQHTDDVLLQTASIRQNLLRMESNMRAYGLSGDPAHVATWARQRADTENRMARLAVLVSDNTAQEARVSALRPRITAWIAHWSPFAAARPTAPGVAPAGLREQLARDLVEHPGREIHGGLNGFAAVERGLLAQRQEQAARLTDLLTALSLFLALAAPSLGGAGAFLLLREGQRARDRELRMQLEHTQRLGLMGETASMLAHELNQPLTAARTYLAVAKSGKGSQPEIMQKAEDQIGRAGGILLRLRNFIEKREATRQPEPPANLVADAVTLLGTINNKVQLHTQLEPGLPMLTVDRIQIQQVLVNLMRNAIEAMASVERREMWLTVARASNGRVIFRLRDSGPGIAPAVAAKLFQPFNSSKDQGMGVGLSICRNIMTEHGGDIWAEAPAGGGACFCFALPVARAA
jgi:two-component system sensor kinase FixL